MQVEPYEALHQPFGCIRHSHVKPQFYLLTLILKSSSSKLRDFGRRMSQCRTRESSTAVTSTSSLKLVRQENWPKCWQIFTLDRDDVIYTKPTFHKTLTVIEPNMDDIVFFLAAREPEVLLENAHTHLDICVTTCSKHGLRLNPNVRRNRVFATPHGCWFRLCPTISVRC